MKQVSDTAAGTARSTPRNIKPAATGKQQSSNPARPRRSRRIKYLSEVEDLPHLDQSVMMFDVVAVGRTPELQHRLERAIRASGDTAASWFNKAVASSVECDEDRMQVNGRGQIRGYGEKWVAEPKMEAAARPPTIAEQLLRIEEELECEIRMEIEHGGPNDGKVTCPDALHRIACFEATRDILLAMVRTGADPSAHTFVVTLTKESAALIDEAAGAGAVSPAAVIASHVEHWQAVSAREGWSMQEERERERERELDAIQPRPPLFAVCPTLIQRAAKMAEFWEIDPNVALEDLLFLEDRIEHPTSGEDAIERFLEDDLDRANRVRKKLADLFRSKPGGSYLGMPEAEAKQMDEVWARIIQFGRLPWDDGGGWDDRASAIEAYLTAPSHKPAEKEVQHE